MQDFFAYIHSTPIVPAEECMPDLLERLKVALADRYAIESELGRGGMATVYLAEDLKHRRKVAIKVLHPELAVTLAADRFLNEIQIAAGLNHPHILSLIDSGEADGLPYYVMPYVEGESLRDRLDPNHGAAFICRAHIQALRGEAELAGAATAQAELLFGEDLPQVVALRALVAALEGDETGALELLETWEEALQASQGYAYLALGR